MGNQKLGFEDFIVDVDSNNRAFVENLHSGLSQKGLKIEVK